MVNTSIKMTGIIHCGLKRHGPDESGYLNNGKMCGLDCERYVFTEVPEHEIPTCPTEEREFSVSALQANRVLHDAVSISTMS